MCMHRTLACARGTLVHLDLQRRLVRRQPVRGKQAHLNSTAPPAQHFWSASVHRLATPLISSPRERGTTWRTNLQQRVPIARSRCRRARKHGGAASSPATRDVTIRSPSSAQRVLRPSQCSPRNGDELQVEVAIDAPPAPARARVIAITTERGRMAAADTDESLQLRFSPYPAPCAREDGPVLDEDSDEPIPVGGRSQWVRATQVPGYYIPQLQES
ncbi:hypothetical protein BJV78DRAFT_415520 [Lactifluus subvellereus]|nr:hypothetical protein BJV78DRAFT_415520 [Lactifluus subvellereus]